MDRKKSADGKEAKHETRAAGAVYHKQSGAIVQTFQDNRPSTVAMRNLQADIGSTHTPTPIQRVESDELPQSGLDTVQRQKDIAPPANKTGMPDNLKAGIESLSGMDMSNVRVHRNSDKPAQLNAHAYAQGNDIHLGPGQERHLAHEAWHVVQQKQGRVAPTLQMKGVEVNDSPALEREADLMGAKALSSRGDTQNEEHAERANDFSVNIVQRSVGLEIESTSSWQVYDKAYKAVTGQHLTLYETPQFRLETELSGKLEFVIEPPLDTPEELLGVMKEVVKVAKAIDGAKITKQKNVRDDFASEYFNEERRKDVDLFKLSDVVKGGAAYYISKGMGIFQGGFQATVGVHLSAVPFLMECVAKGDLIENYPSGNQITKAKSTAEIAREKEVGQPYTWYSGISPAMEGLLNLIYYYIFVGTPTDRRPFPKGITQVMARTNFGKMFSMTPEANVFARYPDHWVKLVTSVAKVDPSRNVFCGTFGDTAENVETVDITIGEWLRGMTEGVDVLSVKGGGPEVLKTMGDMNKTDDLGAQGEANRGVIVELRGLDFNTRPINEWIPFADKIARVVEKLNSRNEDGMQAMEDVSGEEGGRMYWSPWRAEQEGGKNILAMGIEALNAPFKAQVAGLIIRARERAALAKLEKEY